MNRANAVTLWMAYFSADMLPSLIPGQLDLFALLPPRFSHTATPQIRSVVEGVMPPITKRMDQSMGRPLWHL
jgi:hypothetical protein